MPRTHTKDTADVDSVLFARAKQKDRQLEMKTIFEENLSDSLKDRIRLLSAAFRETFVHSATVFARAPGRVNIIGEHIDYMGFSVLPIAIEQDILVAIAASDDRRITVYNLDPRYTPESWDFSDLCVHKETLHWTNFVKCGWRAALELLSMTAPHGMKVLISGEVPPSAGLSSSSALVCASCLAITATLNADPTLNISRQAMAYACMRAERLVGTMGGGMDQAISLLAREGHGMVIDFDPLQATPCALPDRACFVVANSLVESSKYISAGSCYNMRVIECRLAARAMAKFLGVKNWQAVRTLREVQEGGELTKQDMLEYANRILDQRSYTVDDALRLMDCTSITEMQERGHLVPEVSDQPVFRLHQRAHHVLSETIRVDEFVNGGSLEALGMLMDASHSSCRDHFECSCPELDQLCELAKSLGAHGARLTGAGWGGCIVALVDQSDVSNFLAQLRSAYYGTDPRGLEACFVSQPSVGAFLCAPLAT